MNKPDDLVLLGYMAIPDAHIVQGVLEANGIESAIVGETLSTVFGMPLTKIGQTRVFVRRCDFDKAIKVFEDNKNEMTDNHNTPE